MLRKITLYLVAGMLVGSVNSASALLVPVEAENINTIDVGALSVDGSPAVFSSSLTLDGLDYYNFTLQGDVGNSDGTYLNIQTFWKTSTTSLPEFDTMIGLYGVNGVLIAENDDWGAEYPNSQLTFGDSDPIFGAIWPGMGLEGFHGVLSAGDYILVVGGFDTEFTQSINDIKFSSPQRNAGTYDVQFASVVNSTSAQGNPTMATPEPATLILFGTGLLGLAAFKRKAH